MKGFGLFLLKIKAIKLKKLISIFLILSLASCDKQEKPVIAFYYWKTNFVLSGKEQSVLAQNKISKIYLRYFDVAISSKTGNPIPVAMVHFGRTAAEFKIIPVVYIKNEVMLDAKVDLNELAYKIKGTIGQINKKHSISIDEIQIDCDWTLTSRDRYLQFIGLFKKINQPIGISATIRLHQVKYYQNTGIPSVDKGVLMYYNMGKIGVDSLNSIYDRKIAGKYLASLKRYPLPLDIALPVFSNGIHIRSNHVIGLKSKINISELRKDTNFAALGTVFFKAVKSNYRQGIYYKKGDLLKIESISEENLIEMADDLKDRLQKPPKEIILYDLDELNFHNYDNTIFQKISNRF